jgi:WS/DGAT/MGAT family acyltransferase
MHIAAMLVFEIGPVAEARGRVDVDALRAHVGSRLHRMPRYRQRLTRTPLAGGKLWVDDERFDVAAHVRHVRLSRAAGEKGVKAAAAEIISRTLDRSRPLWELWILDGWDAERFAVVTKIHHSMADGIGGVGQLVSLLSMSADEPADQAPEWQPRPAPGLLQLLGEDLSSIGGLGGDAAALVGSVLGDPLGAGGALQRGARALAETASSVVQPALGTPINRTIGAEREIEWLAMPLGELRLIKRRLGGTLNDVVLATVAGALRRYLSRRGVRFEDGEVRAAVPVSMRESESSWGNEVSIWLLPLPVAEQDPEARLTRTRGETARLKQSGNARDLYSLMPLADRVGSVVADAGAYLMKQVMPFNVIVTNVPGPQFPLFLKGARMTSAHPFVPLFENQGLGIALFSYDGTLFWGFLAEPSVVDLPELVYAVAGSFCELLDRATGDAVQESVAVAGEELAAAASA